MCLRRRHRIDGLKAQGAALTACAATICWRPIGERGRAGPFPGPSAGFHKQRHIPTAGFELAGLERCESGKELMPSVAP